MVPDLRILPRMHGTAQAGTLRLNDARVAYQLTSVRERAVMVQNTVPGERWEIEFFIELFPDRPMEAEVFRVGGAIKGPEAIENLLSTHGVFETKTA